MKNIPADCFPDNSVTFRCYISVISRHLFVKCAFYLNDLVYPLQIEFMIYDPCGMEVLIRL